MAANKHYALGIDSVSDLGDALGRKQIILSSKIKECVIFYLYFGMYPFIRQYTCANS